MAFPKNPDKKGNERVRQYFRIAVRDQVAWTAVVNVVGHYLDSKMPAWSYGNRLYRSIWVEKDETGVHTRRFGSYRNSAGQIYLPFGQSWPVFRRHVYLTTRAMTSTEPLPELDQLTAEELELEERANRNQPHCQFVRKEYWDSRVRPDGKENLFWCSIDLKKFYPSIRLDVIQRNILDRLPIIFRTEATHLLASMLRFRLDLNGWRDEFLKQIDINPGRKSFKHIPTGLYVAGFLANASLLNVDIAVEKRLKSQDVAHFRFVDDHIVLAYSFEDLVGWVDQYTQLLADMNTGGKVNPEKIEPEELADFITARKRNGKSQKLKKIMELATKKCKLDPKFPSPLMTKTLALVSAIARTDFNLLDESELASLTDQLEHMLLVEIPETEIPEKTRLTFAATRLIRLAECRLANDARLAELGNQEQALAARLAVDDLPVERREQLVLDFNETEKELSNRGNELDREMKRAFGLLRKVLRDRPDRVRLWSRAINMCRQTGVKGLSAILDDIRDVEKEHENLLAADYLMANILCALSTQVTIAARVLCDADSAEWRAKAAQSFLEDVCVTTFDKPSSEGHSSCLQASWEQFCFGIYCANLIIKTGQPSQTALDLAFPNELVVQGEASLSHRDFKHHQASWAWWAVRMTLRELSPHANAFAIEIGRHLKPGERALAFWRFFPLDVPANVIHEMIGKQNHLSKTKAWEGWWYDALLLTEGTERQGLVKHGNPTISRVLRNIESSDGISRVSLYEWCSRIQTISNKDATDPRSSEWTALEIVRQIATHFAESPTFDKKYLRTAKDHLRHEPCLHPANFRLPRNWLECEEPTWEGWRNLVCGESKDCRIAFVPKEQQLFDLRYTPVHESENVLFTSVNPVRGLGLLLYGLLRKSFDLPTLWNGPGHSDVLNRLPSMLLWEMTCSSLTLGVLQGCLQPRAMENIFHRSLGAIFDYYVDDDTLHDPLRLQSYSDVRTAVLRCQSVLEDNQLSTLDHKARQLTPVSIRLLTQPDWISAFAVPSEGDGTGE
jgi:hypothetical protein